MDNRGSQLPRGSGNTTISLSLDYLFFVRFHEKCRPNPCLGSLSWVRTRENRLTVCHVTATSRGNIGPSLLTLRPDVGRALKKLAKRMLMATRRGLEPLAFAVTGRRDTLLHQRAICNYWWPGWDSNPQNSDFESDTYANSITRPYVTRLKEV